jgi:hypothetical protein
VSVDCEDEFSTVNAKSELTLFDIFSKIPLARGEVDIFGAAFGVSFDFAHEHISGIDGIVVQFFEVDDILGSQWGPGAFLKKSIFFGEGGE